jgi:hypothetical protein
MLEPLVTARRLGAGAAAAAAAGLALLAHAQTPAVNEVMYQALALVAKLEKTEGCDLSLHGAPQLDELTDRWLVAYSGVGAACDDMGAALQREGMAADISFFRRPNSDEVKALLGQMRASVRRGFTCLLVFNGEPQLDDDTDRWTVRYYGSGDQCSEAGEELERQGRAFSISFRRIR